MSPTMTLARYLLLGRARRRRHRGGGRLRAGVTVTTSALRVGDECVPPLTFEGFYFAHGQGSDEASVHYGHVTCDTQERAA